VSKAKSSQKNSENIEKPGVPDPPVVARVVFCRLERTPAASAARSRVIVVVARVKVMSQTRQYIFALC
jgi:hypothetical protein